MTPLDAMLELLARVGASNGAAVPVSEEELGHWPAAAVKAMKSHKLLVKSKPASSVVCPGCEEECVMQVHTLPAGPRSPASFIVCDKRSDINRVAVPSERLRQWRCSAEALCGFVAQSLELRPSSRTRGNTGLWEIGLAIGNRRSQMLCLRANGTLELVAGNNAVPLPELVRFGADGYSVDTEAIRQLVDVATTGEPRYTPSNARREARKLETQALHKSWQKGYRALKKRRPGMSDVWYSREIAKMKIAQGSSAETIRKHLKR
jgi:hypothetical protein